jgi:hypothetical protein
MKSVQELMVESMHVGGVDGSILFHNNVSSTLLSAYFQKKKTPLSALSKKKKLYYQHKTSVVDNL